MALQVNLRGGRDVGSLNWHGGSSGLWRRCALALAVTAHPDNLDVGSEVPWLCSDPRGWMGSLEEP